MVDTAKNAAIRLIESLPEQSTWEDIMYELYVKMKVMAGLNDLAEGRIITQADEHIKNHQEYRP